MSLFVLLWDGLGFFLLSSSSHRNASGSRKARHPTREHQVDIELIELNNTHEHNVEYGGDSSGKSDH